VEVNGEIIPNFPVYESSRSKLEGAAVAEIPFPRGFIEGLSAEKSDLSLQPIDDYYAQWVNIIYNKKGDVLEKTYQQEDGKTHMQFEYDGAQSKLSRIEVSQNGKTAWTMEMTYDSNDRLIQMQEVHPENESRNVELGITYTQQSSEITISVRDAKLHFRLEEEGDQIEMTSQRDEEMQSVILTLDKDRVEKITQGDEDRTMAYKVVYNNNGDPESVTYSSSYQRDGYTYSKQFRYNYEYDKQGNWTKRITHKSETHGDETDELVDVITVRKLIYSNGKESGQLLEAGELLQDPSLSHRVYHGEDDYYEETADEIMEEYEEVEEELIEEIQE